MFSLHPDFLPNLPMSCLGRASVNHGLAFAKLLSQHSSATPHDLRRPRGKRRAAPGIWDSEPLTRCDIKVQSTRNASE